MCCHHRCVYNADKKCRLNAIYALSKIQTNDFVCIERGDYGLLANLKQFIFLKALVFGHSFYFVMNALF